MQTNASVSRYIQQERLEHTAVLAAGIAGTIAAAWRGTKWAVATIADARRERDPDRILSFEA
jgi:hypothetical protein